MRWKQRMNVLLNYDNVLIKKIDQWQDKGERLKKGRVNDERRDALHHHQAEKYTPDQEEDSFIVREQEVNDIYLKISDIETIFYFLPLCCLLILKIR